jgi:chlorobactene glucosyltransferase
MIILQAIITAGLLLFLINIVLNLVSLKKPPKKGEVTQQPMVSVLIPARNEAESITACLLSLQNQNYRNYEILVLDDNSSDATPALVAGMAKQDNKIQLIAGEPLPEGWSGKPFACQQLARKARGDWYIFTDADTTHNPDMIKDVIGMALELNPSLLSGFPRQVANSPLEKMIIPVMYFLVLSWLPLWLMQRGDSPRPTFVNGQFLLFNKGEFWRIGGYEPVKGRIMEDLFISLEMYKRGGKVVTADLSTDVNCHMYHTLGQMWEGFGKSIYGVASASPLIIPVLGLIVYLFYLAPFLWLPHQLFINPPDYWWPAAALQVGLLMMMRLLVKLRFRESIVSTILHPLGISFFMADAIYVLGRQLFRCGISWKERTYIANSGARDTRSSG